MDITTSERLKLRVEALTSRLREVSGELSGLKGASYKVREQMHNLASEALLEGRPQPPELSALQAELTRHEAAMPALEAEEVKLKALHLDARRDHLRQLRKERPGQWLVLD